MIENYESLKVDSKYFQYWDDAAKFCVDKIFDFSDCFSTKNLNEVVVIVLNHLHNNPYITKYDFNVSDEISLLKSIIDFYLETKIWMYDPASLRGTSPTNTVDNAVDIHQSFFLLISYCAKNMYLDHTGINFNNDLITETIIRKQNDYGSNNIAKFGIWGLIVRIHDKIARIENLLSKKRNSINSVSDETVYDTMLDIIGYSAVVLMWLNGWFLYPMKRDAD